MTHAEVSDILDFWFGPPPHGERAQWFRKDDAFDTTIRARWGAAIDAALLVTTALAPMTARETLARVLLLDQFTRNAHRDTPKSFAGDAQALVTARTAIAAGLDRELDPFERWFLYMPFEHAEDAEAQAQSLALFAKLADESGIQGPLVWAQKHAEVIRRFGRYPHRNAILGRASTPAEVAFLAEPGSRF